jgi:hypothetical protein
VCCHAAAVNAGTPGISGADVQNITCADGELTTSIMWSLMRLIDRTCGFPGPINLACNKLLSPPQLCAPDTQVVAAAGNISDGAPPGGKYSANTECSWTISKPEVPFIDINFSRLATERLYDVVTVEVSSYYLSRLLDRHTACHNKKGVLDMCMSLRDSLG